MRDCAKRVFCLLITVVLVASTACVCVYADEIANGEDGEIPAPVNDEISDADDEEKKKNEERGEDDGKEPQPVPNDLPKDDKPAPEPQIEEKPEPDLDEAASEENDGVILATKIYVSAEKTTLFPGDSTRAHCQVLPEGASGDVKWVSSNEKLARISKDGVIKIARNVKIPEDGECVDIWAKAKDGSLVMDLTTIRIMPQITRVRLFMGDLTVYSGDEAPFISVYVDIQPQSLFGKTQIIWQSSDPKIAMVAPGGEMGEAARIIWYEPGRAVIKAYSASDPSYSDKMTLTVLPPKK